MKRLLIPILIALLLSSCISTQRLSGIIYKIHNDLITDDDSLQQEYININCSNFISLGTFSRTEYLRSTCIPALLYWQWNNDIKCEINQKTLCGFIKTNMLKDADSMDFKNKLNGKRLEISLEKIPNTFTYLNDGFAVIVLVAYMVGGQEVIIPEQQNLCLSYTIFEKNTVLKTGKIELPTTLKAITNRYQSTKNFTLDYLDEYVSILKKMSKLAMVRLKDEI